MSKSIQLAEARSALARLGKSPRQIGDEARLQVLEWIYRWGYSSATIIQLLLNRTSAGYATKLVKQGWLISTKSESGMPKAYFTLSPSGLAEVERHASELLRYQEIDPYRVNQKLIRHNLVAQRATINAINAGLATEYQTERMLTTIGNQTGTKLPDIVLKSSSNLRIAIEIELSAKWERDLDQFVLGIAHAIQTRNSQPARFDRFAIISDSPAILERYRAAMQPNSPLKLWSKNQRSHWVSDKATTVPNWLIEKVDFQLIER